MISLWFKMGEKQKGFGNQTDSVCVWYKELKLSRRFGEIPEKSSKKSKELGSGQGQWFPPETEEHERERILRSELASLKWKY